MSEQFNCWKCGTKLVEVILPMSRREECHSCHSDQHVCKMCQHFDKASRSSCLEERADYVADRERANFCDYFSPSTAAFSADSIQKQQQAKAKLAALFGDKMPPLAAHNNPGATPELGIPVANSDRSETPSEIADRKLRELLGD